MNKKKSKWSSFINCGAKKGLFFIYFKKFMVGFNFFFNFVLVKIILFSWPVVFVSLVGRYKILSTFSNFYKEIFLLVKVDILKEIGLFLNDIIGIIFLKFWNCLN